MLFFVGRVSVVLVEFGGNFLLYGIVGTGLGLLFDREVG
jgi:hypothetical protein